MTQIRIQRRMNTWADPEGGRGSGPPPPPEKSQKYSFIAILGQSTEKVQGYQASIQCWAIIGTPAKRRILWYLDPLSSH